MSNFTHFKVLLKKNFLTLKRKWGFLLFFVLLPCISIGIFAAVKYAIQNGMKEEGHNFDKLYFSSTAFQFYETAQFGDIPSDQITPDRYTSLFNCKAGTNPLDNYGLVGTPENIAKFDIVEKALEKMMFVGHHYTDKEDLLKIVRTEKKPTYCFGLQIDKFEVDTNEYEVQVMWQRKSIPDTNRPSYDLNRKTPDFMSWKQYKNSGFMGIHAVIVNAILSQKGKQAQLDVAYMPLKTPKYEDINPLAVQQLELNFPFFLMFTFLIPLYYFVSKLAEEKESKSREGMKMMGLKDSSYFLSWFFFYLIICAGMCLLILAISSINVFVNSNKLLIFAMCMLYGMSLFGFSVTIVAILPSVRASATAASLAHVITYFIIFALQDPDLPSTLKVALSIFPNIGMSFCVYNLYHFENDSNGLTFSTAAMWYNNVTFYSSLGMLFIDCVLFLFLGLYLDQVLQSQFGVAKKWYFLCTRKFWCAKRKVKSNISPESESFLLNNDEEISDVERRNPHDFENVPETLRRQEQTRECLKIRGLRKEFGPKIAVQNTNMTIYNGQIFALLGHNGAGKTTTISMLTGLIQATKGSAQVFDLSIFDDMDEFRKILGVCPQHDVLFEFLTPREHLQLFAAFKGTPNNEIDNVVNQMLKDIDLLEVEHQLAKTLSGGQKRKLSVGIAMIGNSKIVILDEPSSGMDTSSRRRLWEMLKSNKAGKIIILTTHYMDEADILGDRICIMAEGSIKCCGSSLFLKNRYGVGYNLVIAKRSRDPAPQIDDFINSRIPNAKKLQEVSSEMTFQLPSESASLFKDFFTQLDLNLDPLNIRSYGVGITTLEEVFLRIGKGESEKSDDEDEELKQFTLDKNSSPKKITESGEFDEYSIAEQHEEGTLRVFLLNLGALMKKKLILQIRDPRILMIEILFPIIFIFAGLALANVKAIREGKSVLMGLGQVPKPSHCFFNQPASQGNGSPKDFVNNYFSKNQWDTFQEVDVPTDVDYVTQVSYLDDFMFAKQKDVSNGIFGNYYFNNIDKSVPAPHYSIFALVNATSQDAVAGYSAYIHQAFLQDVLDEPELSLKIYNTPFPLTILEQGVVSAAAGTSVSILFAIAYMMVSDSLIQNIIRERQRNVKHQMIISGVSLPAYWMSHYLLDIIFQAPPSICAIIGIQIFDLDFPYAWVVVLIFIFTNPVFVYSFSCLFDSDSSASIVTRLSYVMMGSILPIAIQVLLVIESTVKVGKIIRWFFYILPIYTLNIGISAIANRKVQAAVEGRNPDPPLSMDVAGPAILFLIADIFLYWAVMIAYEKKVWRFFARNRPTDDDQRGTMIDSEFIDEDIVDEERRVEQADPNALTVKVLKAKKTYGSVTAVQRVTFGLEYGECFALLGISGAGKTTTFKCLTGEVIPSMGEVMINGHDVTRQSGFEEARRMIGYCPQFDAIFERMTVREHLEFYAKVKGILASYRVSLIEKQLDEMDLREFENVWAMNLSGGNKRKLSVAMALIGNPPIVFLDEPSTGVDPKAKRFMWTIVSKISTVRKKSSVIITTHSMEEAEALCTKMGIMVAGQFKCFGTSQHIKTKYGTGYEIEIKIKYLKEDDLKEIKQELCITHFGEMISLQEANEILEKFDSQHLSKEISKDGIGSEFYFQLQSPNNAINLDEFIRWVFTESRGTAVLDRFESMFAQVEVLEHYSNSYKIKVSRDNYTIGFLFGMMEDIRNEYSISEYSISQTTLEQIFNQFAKEAEKGNQRRRTTIARKTDKERGNKGGTMNFRLKTERMQTEKLDNTQQ